MPQIIHSHPPAGQRQSTPLRIFQTRKDIPHTPLGMRELDTAIRGIIRAAPARRHIHGMTNRNLTDHPIRKQSQLQTLIRHTPTTQTPGNQMDRIRLSHMPRIRIHIHAMRGPHQNPGLHQPRQGSGQDATRLAQQLRHIPLRIHIPVEPIIPFGKNLQTPRQPHTTKYTQIL